MMLSQNINKKVVAKFVMETILICHKSIKLIDEFVTKRFVVRIQ